MPLKILFVTPEVVPFAKVGGLADVTSSLPKALRRLGHHVSTIVPLYGAIDRERHGLAPTQVELAIRMDGRLRPCRVWKKPRAATPTYFIENEDYFSGREVYGDARGDYPDNAFRFAYFSRAATDAARALDLGPDVLHLHDWQTALVPVYGSPVPTVLTIHNLAYQGICPRDWLARLELPEPFFHIEGLEFYGKINFLKGGALKADGLTTVSPTYAKEIQTEEYGAGLEGVVRSRVDRLVGILNGIEPSEWPRGRKSKKEHKRALQAELGLEVSERIPFLAVIGRLDRQKGFDILYEAAPALLEEGVELVVLGSGNEAYLDQFRKLAERYPRRLAAERGFQDHLGRRIYAGADIFLMPSRYEPCGLGQMIALRFGTIPVVRATGGLADTIRDLDEDPEHGNGFCFRELSAESLLAAIRRALHHFEDQTRWKRWVARVKREDFTWKQSAQAYVETYEAAIRRA